MFPVDLDIRLLLRSGLSRLMVALSAGGDTPPDMPRFWRRGTDFILAALETLDNWTGLGSERAVGRFPLLPLFSDHHSTWMFQTCKVATSCYVEEQESRLAVSVTNF